MQDLPGSSVVSPDHEDLSGCLDPQTATKTIREIVRRGEIKTGTHCKQRMKERGFSFQDLLSILMNGEVKDEAQYHKECRQYRFRVEGPTIDDGEAIAVTVIIDKYSVFVVSVF